MKAPAVLICVQMGKHMDIDFICGLVLGIALIRIVWPLITGERNV